PQAQREPFAGALSPFPLRPGPPNRAGFMRHDPILEPPRAREGWRGEIAATFALAWPLALANFAQMFVNAIDVIFVARLGDVPLAASSSTYTVVRPTGLLELSLRDG